MKKYFITIFILLSLILSACSSSQAAVDSYSPNQNESVPVSDGTLQYEENDSFSQSVDAIPQADPQQQATAGDVPQGIEDFYSGQDEVTFEDFDFFMDYMYYGAPDDAYYPAVKYAAGNWKYNLLFRYDSSSQYYDELGHADISVDYDKDVLIVILHPELGNDGYESWPMTDADAAYEPFEGGFDENDNLRLYGNDAVLDVQCYYDSQGREYFISQIWISEEESGYLLLVRGQN